MGFFFTLVALVVTLGLTWRYLGSYMAAVFDGRVHFLGFVERPIYRLLGTSPTQEQTWKRYAGALVIFSGVSFAFTYVILRIQGSLPLNPQHLGAVGSALSFNTASSFLTNTNWQNYAGETTMSYFSQIGALTVQQFVSAAVGIASAIALVRGFQRKNSPTIGNFWVDLTRCLFYVLLPMAFIAGIIFVGQGAVETLAGTASIHDVLNGVTQTIARGPIGFMEAIKQLGTNGGGFLNQNGATTFENPTGLTNFLSFYIILSIPFALTYTSSALYNVAATQTSTGSIDSAGDSYTPIGGMGLLTGMMMGEVTPGGTGTGLYTILLYASIAVFIGGLTIGRTPEYLGKKIQAAEVKLAGLGALVMPIIVLVLTAIAVSLAVGRAGPLNAGPHGFTEILYALTSQANNNGSAFAGLSGNTPFYNVIGGIDMLIGRFGIMIPAIALGGHLAAKGVVPESLGTFRTDNGMFVGLTIGVILIIGGLTFFPALALGPIVEQLSHLRFF